MTSPGFLSWRRRRSLWMLIPIPSRNKRRPKKQTIRLERQQLWTFLQSNYWAIGKYHDSHLQLGKEEHRQHKLNRHIARARKGTQTSVQRGPLPARLPGQSYGCAHEAMTRWRFLTASGQNDSLTILYLAEKLETLDWETLQVTCPTFHATLGTEKTVSDSDWEERKEVEVVCATKCRKD